MTTKDVWGPATWTLFHTLAEKVNDEHFNEIKTDLFLFIKRICFNLPCPDCAAHATQTISKVSPSSFENKQQLKTFLFNFHNSVNARTGKPAFSFEELNSKYARANTFVVVPYFIKVYSYRNTNVRLLINSFHKDILIKDFIKWMRENASKFKR